MTPDQVNCFINDSLDNHGCDATIPWTVCEDLANQLSKVGARIVAMEKAVVELFGCASDDAWLELPLENREAIVEVLEEIVLTKPLHAERGDEKDVDLLGSY